jgi:adenosylcobinamide-GDP ribazoletransferase
MVRLMRNLRAAISFLTRVPMRINDEPDQAAAVPWFPVVGALIGLAVGGAAAGLVHLVPPLVTATLAVLLGVLITGAFHEDGLADVADAFAGGWTPKARLEIMKDPRHGTYGVAALCGSIVLRIACVAALAASPAAAFGTLVAAHTLGRVGAVLLMATVPPARSDGLGAAAARSLRARHVVVGMLAGVAIAALATGWWIGPFLLALALSLMVVGRMAMSKISGISGDVLGAAEQVIEGLVLVVATGLATRYTVWWR